MGNFLHQTLIFNGGNEFPDLLPLTAHKAWPRVSAVLHVSSELQHLFPGVSNEKRASAASVFWALRLFCVASLNPFFRKALEAFFRLSITYQIEQILVTCRPGNPENGGQTRSGCVGPSWAFIRKKLSFVTGNGFKSSFSHRWKTHFSLLKGRLLLQDFKTVNCNLDDAHSSSQTTYEDKVSRQRPLNDRTTPQSHIVPLRPLSCRQRMLTNLLIPVYIN